MTEASMWKGLQARTVRTTSRNTSTCSTSKQLLRSNRLTVKK
jgi:hypothetical protein